MNLYKNSTCEVCNSRAPVSSISVLEDLTDTSLDSQLDSSIGSVFLPLKSCSSKRRIEDVDNGGGEDSGGFDGFRGVLKKMVTVKGVSLFDCFFLCALD